MSDTRPEWIELDPCSLNFVEFVERILNIKLMNYQKAFLEEYERKHKKCQTPDQN